MLSAKVSMIMCLGASLSMAGDKLSLWAKMGVVGLAWLAAGGFKTVSIVLQTMPRDLQAIWKIVQLTVLIKRAQRRNLTVPRMFYESVRRFPDRVLFYFKDEEWTFRRVEEYSNRIANYFLSEGYTKGDAVAVFMANRPEFVCVWLGLAKIGVVPALVNNNLRSDPLLHSITVAKCRAIVFSSELSGAVESIFGLLMSDSPHFFPTYSLGLPASSSTSSTSSTSTSTASLPGCKHLDSQLELSSPAPVEARVQDSINFSDKLMFIYTSGTTGMPKAAVIKHSRYILAGGGLTIMMGVRLDDRVYCPLPLYHSVGGMISLSGCMYNGISMVMREKFSASSYWRDCVKYRVTAAQYIGEICRYLLNTPESEYESQHSVRLMFGNGLRPEIWTDFIQRFNIAKIAEFYGSTEGNSQVLNFDNTVGAVGFIPVLFSAVLPLGPIRVDENGDPVRDPLTGLCIRCKVGEPGEFVGIIQQKNPIREFIGYSDKDSTQKKVLHDVWRKGDLCFRSGDILVSDEYGYLYFKDRKGDTYRWKGENVSTAEVEAIISRSAGLTDAVVYGVQIPGCEGRIGMAAIAEDIGNDGRVDLIKLAGDLNERLASYARPAFIRLVRELDITGTFKLKKRDLQVEGYDVTKIQDPLFFYLEGNYVPLTKELYDRIQSGSLRL